MKSEIVPGLSLRVKVFRLHNVKGDEVANAVSDLQEDCNSDLVVVGIDEQPDICRAIVAYIHLIEALERGTRIRNHNLRFLMEYYGESQLNRILERIREPGWLLSVYKPRCEQHVNRIVSFLGAQVAEADCSIENVYNMVEAAVLSGVREGY